MTISRELEEAALPTVRQIASVRFRANLQATVKSNVTSPSQCQVNKSPQMGLVGNKLVMPVSAEKIWAAAQEMLRTMLNSDIYNLWFAPVRAAALEGEQIILEVANDFCEVWLKDNYLDLIQDVLMHPSGQPLKVR